MYLSNVKAMSLLAKEKVAFLNSAKFSYIVSSMLAGFVNNLTWVTLGNVIGGGIFVGAMYWLATYKEKE